MIRQLLVKRIASKPANGDIDVSLAHQLAVMDDASQQASKHQTNRHLRIDTGPTIVATIAISDLAAQPRQIENAIDTHEHMVVRNKLP